MGGVTVGGGGHTQEDQLRLNARMSERARQQANRGQFDSDVAYAKRGLGMDAGDKKVYSKERGMGPSMAGKRLEDVGVDIPGLIDNRVSPDANDGNLKRGGAVKKMASGGSVSSRADGIAQRGKTRGKMC